MLIGLGTFSVKSFLLLINRLYDANDTYAMFQGTKKAQNIFEIDRMLLHHHYCCRLVKVGEEVSHINVPRDKIQTLFLEL